MKIFDTHAHYDDSKFDDDRKSVIEDNIKNGVKKIVNVSCDLESCKKSIELSRTYENIYFALGLHPESVNLDVEKDISIVEDLIKEQIRSNKLVAIGEIGLDYHYTSENKELQKLYFEKQLELAMKYELSVIIHCRDASDDMYHILKDKKYANLKIVFHCFQPTDCLTHLILQRKYMIGIGGNITYKRSEHSLELIKKIPIDQIIVETDAPYLSPVPVRGTRNESKNIKYVIEKLSEIKSIEIKDLEDILYNNSMKFYNIKRSEQ